jgi:hypothetical protein
MANLGILSVAAAEWNVQKDWLHISLWKKKPPCSFLTVSWLERPTWDTYTSVERKIITGGHGEVGWQLYKMREEKYMLDLQRVEGSYFLFFDLCTCFLSELHVLWELSHLQARDPQTTSKILCGGRKVSSSFSLSWLTLCPLKFKKTLGIWICIEWESSVYDI